jgi:hypothetical protein
MPDQTLPERLRRYYQVDTVLVWLLTHPAKFTLPSQTRVALMEGFTALPVTVAQNGCLERKV